jgi:hypothetical protein
MTMETAPNASAIVVTEGVAVKAAAPDRTVARALIAQTARRDAAVKELEEITAVEAPGRIAAPPVPAMREEEIATIVESAGDLARSATGARSPHPSPFLKDGNCSSFPKPVPSRESPSRSARAPKPTRSSSLPD